MAPSNPNKGNVDALQSVLRANNELHLLQTLNQGHTPKWGGGSKTHLPDLHLGHCNLNPVCAKLTKVRSDGDKWECRIYELVDKANQKAYEMPLDACPPFKAVWPFSDLYLSEDEEWDMSYPGLPIIQWYFLDCAYGKNWHQQLPKPRTGDFRGALHEVHKIELKRTQSKKGASKVLFMVPTRLQIRAMIPGKISLLHGINKIEVQSHNFKTLEDIGVQKPKGTLVPIYVPVGGYEQVIGGRLDIYAYLQCPTQQKAANVVHLVAHAGEKHVSVTLHNERVHIEPPYHATTTRAEFNVLVRLAFVHTNQVDTTILHVPITATFWNTLYTIWTRLADHLSTGKNLWMINLSDGAVRERKELVEENNEDEAEDGEVMDDE
ncbi:hypothetical protein BDV96DRAFT_116412 [Lophiotrema nucula]|uniref:Uncharacterized protein n=1 Tax=Lophiotrema nucula TaxID=690887 RepID=A0A6A5Z3W1_9PLEO|nr:hypothetical protein BDV96DRAFT_116412 [Lophiotrema nucula]